MKRSVIPSFALLIVAGACSPRTDVSEAAVVASVTDVVQQMAANASARNVQANLGFVPMTSKVVYVSNGAPITGDEYARELGASYAGRDQMSFRWERLEVTPLGRTAAAVTGWAATSVTPAGGKPIRGRYIFTMVFAKDGTRWKRVLAQKAPLSEP